LVQKEIESAHRMGTDPSIELSSADISIVDPLKAVAQSRISDDDDEDAETHQRYKDGAIDDEVGTRPETPDLLRHRQPPRVEPRKPAPKPAAGPDSRRSPEPRKAERKPPPDSSFDDPPTN